MMIVDGGIMGVQVISSSLFFSDLPTHLSTTCWLLLPVALSDGHNQDDYYCDDDDDDDDNG